MLRERLPQHSKRWWLPYGPAPLWACTLVGPLLGLPAALTRAMYGKRPHVCTERASRELGLAAYIEPEDTVVDMALAMMELRLMRNEA